jgi:hypothetical protein
MGPTKSKNSGAKVASKNTKATNLTATDGRFKQLSILPETK